MEGANVSSLWFILLIKKFVILSEAKNLIPYDEESFTFVQDDKLNF